jgi:Kelch motif
MITSVGIGTLSFRVQKRRTLMTGTWQGLINQPNFNTSTMILLTDGRVMVQEEATAHWHALTPDSNGSYLNGTWSTLKDMSFWRRYYASGVLKDGRVIVCGGEQTGAGGDTNLGEIYDPVSDSWSPIPTPPGWPIVGDAASCILPSGKLMIGALLTPACIIYDPVTNSWSPAANKAVRSNEEGWILLPDDTIVTTQCWAPFQTEKYIISSNTWKNEGALPVTIVDPSMHEMGPGMLMYNRKVIFFGSANQNGNGKTVIYSLPALPTGTGTWTAGPDIPKIGKQTIVCNDCPASLMPNGKVLFAAANFLVNNWGSPILFFEYDPVSNTISQAPTPPNNAMQLYWSRMMLLPTGQVLFSPSTKSMECYTPDGGPQEAWRPTISAVIPHCSNSQVDYYLLKGTQLNGLSQANTYGDDCYPATNYPIVRLRNNQTNRIYYCRSYNFSTMGVATGASLQSVRFITPNIPYGAYDLCVIANGISSHCVNLCHSKPCKPCCHEPKCGCTETCCHQECSCCEYDDRAGHPEVVELKQQVRSLQNSLNRLGAPPPEFEHQPKETQEQEHDENQKKKEK